MYWQAPRRNHSQASDTPDQEADSGAQVEPPADQGVRGGTPLLPHITTPGNPNTHRSQIRPSRATTAASASDEQTQQTTQAGRPRQRIKWTTQMNKDVIHCYMVSTELESNTRNYRGEMLKLFLDKYPELQPKVNTQNIVDRKRAIITTKLLSATEIEDIKQKILRSTHQIEPAQDEDRIEREMGAEETENLNNIQEEQQQNEEREPTEPIIEIDNQDMQNNEPDIPDNVALTAENHFRTAVIEFVGTDPIKRVPIPKIKPNQQIDLIIRHLNRNVLPQFVSEANSIGELHLYIYCMATAVTRTINSRTNIEQNNKQKQRKPRWMQRLEKRISDIRAKLGRLHQYKNGNIKKLKTIKQCIHPIKLEDLTSNKLTDILDTLRQQLAVYSKRLKRYTKCSDRKKQNKEFERNQKIFYRELEGDSKQNQNQEIPEIPEVTRFWANIWENPVYHNNESVTIKEEKERMANMLEMNAVEITLSDVSQATKKTSNWKAPGPDSIHNFWLKKATALHGKLAKHLNEILHKNQELPEFLTIGKTYLLPKGEYSRDPAKYRPITCLCTLYKLLTSILSNKIYDHLHSNNIMTEEQKGCYKNSQGCKDQVTIDTVVVKQALNKKRNLSMAYIDYKKAFDSTPHSFLLEILKIYKINNNIIQLISSAMETWSTTLYISNGERTLQTRKISIRRGIFQGDSLSALWFCVGLNPLSNTLSQANYGFKIKSHNQEYVLNHLLYMDDLKLYANSQDQLEKLVQITENFSNDIHMEFGIDKCKTINLERGILISNEGIRTNDNQLIESLAESEHYKYLGFMQLKGIKQTEIKEALRKKFGNRLRSILRTQLNTRNKTIAINTYAIPILIYSFGIISWTKTDIEELERSIRVSLTKNRMRHPKAAIERITLPHEEGGLGITDLKMSLEKQIHRLRQYFYSKNNIDMYQVITKADVYTPLNLRDQDQQTEVQNIQDKIDQWKAKALHGTHPHELEQTHVDKITSNLWLKRGTLHAETTGYMMAIQDRVIATRNYKKHIIKEPNTNDTCRRCNKNGETIEHIIGACTTLAPIEYTKRHNNVAKIIFLELANKTQLENQKQPYYKYEPPPVLENQEFRIYWDKNILTDITIASNKPDIVLYNKATRTVELIEIAVPLNRNMQETFSRKISKYIELSIELKQLWNLAEVKIKPIIISNTGIVMNATIQQLKELKIEYLIPKIQQSVILDTCHIVRKFLNQN